MVHRQNTVVADRLAILANLCNYRIRLDSHALDRLGYEFSICAITMAVLNGDLSLMANARLRGQKAPGQTMPLSFDIDSNSEKREMGFSWMTPSSCSIDDLITRDKREFLLNRVPDPILEQRGLRVKGTLWRVDALELSELQQTVLGLCSQHELALALDINGVTDPSAAESTRVRILLQMLCHLHDKGFTALSERIWQTTRETPSARALKADIAVSTYMNAKLEDVVDLESATVTWPSPIKPSRPMYAKPPSNPFAMGNFNEFIHYLLASVIRHGILLAGRLQTSERQPCAYAAFFEDAEAGQEYFAPTTNYGVSSPLSRSRYYTWYPIAWRVARATADAHSSTYRCHSLVRGNWFAYDEDVTAVHLV